MARLWVALATFVLAAAMSGCASAPRSAAAPGVQTGPWSGRMSLQVQDQPSDSFAAFFELSGSSQAGELSLFSPLGGTLAVLTWQPGRATLQAGSNVTRYDSVDELLRRASGTRIPVTALFDWLSGVQTQVAGWTADLSDWPSGRVQAKRIEPLPEADLRVILDR